MTDLTLSDLAEQVLAAHYDGTKDEWGEELLDLAEAHELPDIDDEVRRKTVTALGTMVSQKKAKREQARKREEAKARAARFVDSEGKPLQPPPRSMTPTISVKTKTGESALVLWTRAHPRQFMDAVLREQKVIDGRNDSNQIRMHVVRILQEDERLQDLDNLQQVCDELGINPDELGLDELETA